VAAHAVLVHVRDVHTKLTSPGGGAAPGALPLERSRRRPPCRAAGEVLRRLQGRGWSGGGEEEWEGFRGGVRGSRWRLAGEGQGEDDVRLMVSRGVLTMPAVHVGRGLGRRSGAEEGRARRGRGHPSGQALTHLQRPSPRESTSQRPCSSASLSDLLGPHHTPAGTTTGTLTGTGTGTGGGNGRGAAARGKGWEGRH